MFTRVYGRRFELVVADSGGTPAGTLAATRELLESRRVFALVGPLALSHVPPAAPNPSLFYLLPTARDQAAALVEYIREASERSRGGAQGTTKLAVLGADDEFDREAAEGARARVESTRSTTVGAKTRPLTLALTKDLSRG